MKITFSNLHSKLSEALSEGSLYICITSNIYISVTLKNILNIYSECTQGFMCLYFYPLQQM